MEDTAVDGVFGGASSISVPAYQMTHPAVGDTGALRGELGHAIAELPSRQRQVLSLRYLAGLDDVDVSEALGISVRAVRKHAARGISALRAGGVIREANLLLG